MEWHEGTVVARWNEAALQAIRADKPVPTVITRALHVAHAAMYDVWAAFDREAEGAYFNPRRTLRMPGRRHREGFLESAISAAAHRTLVELFPDHRDRFDQLLGEFSGFSRSIRGMRMGGRVGRKVLARRARDGSNVDNGYTDSSGYQPMNDPESDFLDPNYWTPLKVPTGAVLDEYGIPVATDDPLSYQIQSPLTPHWGRVRPFEEPSPAPSHCSRLLHGLLADNRK